MRPTPDKHRLAEAPAAYALPGEGQRKKMSLSISEPLAEAARQLDINLSRAAEAGILMEIKRRRDDEWLARNRPAIAAYNERIEREGLFAEEQRSF